jgi:hypothetical protein
MALERGADVLELFDVLSCERHFAQVAARESGKRLRR